MVPHRSGKFGAAFILKVLIGYEIVGNNLAAQFYNLFDENTSYTYYNEARSKGSQIYNGIIYEDGIVHVEINELNPAINQIKAIEDSFKNILAMNGVKYIFKRNFYWRTWREVEDSDGKSKLVCYRCQNVFNVTCRSCNCGYWEIEENPPCPFEIFSVINGTNMCGAYYQQLKNSNCNCPSILSFRDLGNCDNPLETTWRISSQHDATDISGRNVNVICKGRENCHFSTIYSIFPDRVTFRIINSSHNIVYSKVMKNGNRNYACLNACGVFKTLAQIESDRKTPPFTKFRTTTEKGSKKTKEDTRIDSAYTIKPNNIPRNTLYFSKMTTKPSIFHCKHLQITHSDEDSEESEYNDYKQ